MFGKKRLTAVVLTLLMVVGSACPAMAAQGTKISSISLRITSDIEAGTEDGDVEVTTTNNKYYVEDFYITNQPDGPWKKGNKPKVKITLMTEEGEYYFKTGFSKNDISLSGTDATVASVSRHNATTLVLNVTLGSLDAGSGEYDLEVYELQWDEDQGQGYWGEAGDARKYEVKVYRGDSLLNSSTVTTTEAWYDFSRYLTKSGTYMFRVRAVYNSSYKGDWEDSDSFYVNSAMASEFREANEDSSDSSSGSAGGPGSSAPGTPSAGGPGSGSNSGAWLQDDTGWWYCNADRSYTVNNWQYISDKWYFFNEKGYMVTGWILWKGVYYYCGPNGDMWTDTWTPDNFYVDSDGVWVQGKVR